MSHLSLKSASLYTSQDLTVAVVGLEELTPQPLRPYWDTPEDKEVLRNTLENKVIDYRSY